MRLRIGILVLGMFASVLIATTATAQQTSAIAGAVTDATGKPVADVAVEAASPALIEKVRKAVTDSKGEFKILDVPIGTYEITFTAGGFTTLKHTGIEVQAAFTATVNESLRAGSPTETMTVTAAVAQVDAQNSSTQERLSSETNQVLPSGQQAMSNVANVTGGMTFTTADVGGISGLLANAGNGATYHGKSGIKRVLDGLRIDDLVGTGSAGYLVNPIAIQNTVTETGGGNAESLAAGFTINNIPKSGSNTFKFDASGLYTNSSFQGNNLDATQKALGLTSVNRIVHLYDYSADSGGPIKEGQLWFFIGYRTWGTTQQRTNIFYDATEGSAIYTPDLARPANRYDYARSPTGHFTWQASAKNKFDVHIDPQNNCFCGGNGFYAIEADDLRRFYPNAAYQVGWTSPITTKLLLEAKGGFVPSSWPYTFEAGVVPGSISITEASTAFYYNSPLQMNTTQDSNRYNQRFSAAYVTGSHAFKVGISDEEGVQRTVVQNAAAMGGGNNVDYTFLHGVPNLITEYATPYEHVENMNADLGIFAQDQWTIRRLTLNYGVRFDYFNSSVPAQNVPATQFVPARSFPAVNDVPDWKDVSPRVGAAYDLFGDGKTVVKGAIGKFMNLQAVAIANANNPLNTSVNSVTRTWTDTDLSLVDALGDYIPNCNLQNPNANGNCGKISNAAFGGPAIVTTYASNLLQGWGVRDHIWDSSLELQRVLGANAVARVGYYRNWGENFYATDNVAVNPSEYSPYCVTAPADARLPGGGGNQICGLYDIAPADFNVVKNVVQPASNFGQQNYVNNFFNVSITSRFGQGIRLGGSLDTGRTTSNQCFVVNNPEQANYNLTSVGAASATAASATSVLPCYAVSPWMANLQVKLNGSYPLPLGLTLSGTFQNLAGPQILANYPAPNSAIAPSLGRNLAACGTQAVCTATASVPLITPGTMYEPRRTQLDLRLTKVFPIGARLRLTGKLDVYNVLNNNSSITINTTYGPSWLTPTSIVDGRVAEFSGALTF